ncbi:zinc-dependent alcohol dehydrogenase family protein [Methylacidimicrobium sp. B4]|uniref:zinc-dependent alcohol dehydrogenase family protein n=1 Tax=Methylacidimicrobium sp. B4 TaxID=2796139 RepID=UPI001A8FC538|nr:zinc-dependent alcohol dehydrogenase family protein [Methylacidimicrobium sp. B4]QSR84323.1 zinc-dependent alcohol dehydrogenase family protein [Methylacidimicrobium sp. B4]
MKAMVWDGPGSRLVERDLPTPEPGEGELLLRVRACGVCRTDLHVIDGELPQPKRPLIPGHEVVGTVVRSGPGARRFSVGERVGVPWLGKTCGECRFCRTGRENLCEHPEFTGYTRDGGYAEYLLADERFVFALPEGYADGEAAPLLCAGLIGYRSYRKAEGAHRLGFYGFGAAAHLLVQLAVAQGKEVYAFTRAGDAAAQALARELGAVWTGASTMPPPDPLDAAILFAPVGDLIPAALRAVDRGGKVVCAGIHMSHIPSFPYRLLWEEREIGSVANLTREDGEEFFSLARRVHFRTHIHSYPLSRANEALDALREGQIAGAAVLFPDR